MFNLLQMVLQYADLALGREKKENDETFKTNAKYLTYC